MTPAQIMVVGRLKADGFIVVTEGRHFVRLRKNSDERVVHANGSQERSTFNKYQAKKGR